MFIRIFSLALLAISVGHTVSTPQSEEINEYNYQENMDEDWNSSESDQNEIISEQVYSFKSRPTSNLINLSPEDLKCLTEFNGLHCSEHMKKVKMTIITAIQDQCRGCTIEDKAEAGKVMTTVMRNYPYAWKVVYTRYKTPTPEEDLPVPDNFFFLKPRGKNAK